MVAVRHLGFVWDISGPSTKSRQLVVFIVVQNLVVINAAVSIIDHMKVSIFCAFGLKTPIHVAKLGF